MAEEESWVGQRPDAPPPIGPSRGSLPAPDSATRIPAEWSSPPAQPNLGPVSRGQISRGQISRGQISSRQSNGPQPQSWLRAAPVQSSGSDIETRADDFDWSESRWGLGDLLLGLPVVVASVVVAAVVGLVFARFVVIDIFQPESTEAARSSIMDSALVISMLLGFQAALFGWPLIVAKWKGRGARHEFGFRFRWVDLVIGPTSAIGMLICAGVITQLVALLVGLDDVGEASNTDILTSSDGGFARNMLFFSVVVGAPFCEELFFRGLAMRAIHKRFSLAAGWFGSTLLFAGPHFQSGSWQAVVTLLSSIAVIGSFLGALAAFTKRLGPGIIAHMCFNGIAVLVTVVFADELRDLDSALGFLNLLPWGGTP